MIELAEHPITSDVPIPICNAVTGMIKEHWSIANGTNRATTLFGQNGTCAAGFTLLVCVDQTLKTQGGGPPDGRSPTMF